MRAKVEGQADGYWKIFISKEKKRKASMGEAADKMLFQKTQAEPTERGRAGAGECESLEGQPGPQLSMPFSTCRSSDDQLSSCLLRAVAQLRSQLWAHLPRAPPASHRSPSAWRWVGGTLVVPAVLWQHPRLCLIALCETRGSPPARPTRAPELGFNWKLFWHFLHPHLLALGAAIVVRLPAPPCSGQEGPRQLQT